MIPWSGIWTGVKDRSRRRPSCSGAQLSNLIQFKKGENQQRGERRREGREKKKITAAKKEITNSIYYTQSKALLTLLTICFIYKLSYLVSKSQKIKNWE